MLSKLADQLAFDRRARLHRMLNKSALYQGTTSVVPYNNRMDEGFTGCGKTKFFEGYGLQPVL
jgi:hypothetical protein